jgi:hypothetical protein
VTEEAGGVVITNKDIYTEVVKMKEAVTAMAPLALTAADHETRIRSLEKWKYALPASLVAGGIGLYQSVWGARHG